MGLRIKEGMRLVYCGSSEHMQGVEGVVVRSLFGTSLCLKSGCGARRKLPTNTSVWVEKKVAAPTEKAGDPPHLTFVEVTNPEFHIKKGQVLQGKFSGALYRVIGEDASGYIRIALLLKGRETTSTPTDILRLYEFGFEHVPDSVHPELAVGQVWKGKISGHLKKITGVSLKTVSFSSDTMTGYFEKYKDSFVDAHTLVSSPEPVKEEYIIVSAANHRGQGRIFQSYEEAETHAAKITHNVLICKVVAKATTKTVVEKV